MAFDSGSGTGSAARPGSRWAKYFDAETVAKLACIGFKPSLLVEGSLVGNHRSPFHGFAVEFAGHRGYVPGDDVKNLDWKVYYRTGKHLIKQYEQETNFVAHILVDVSASMDFSYKHGSKKDYAAFIASALSHTIVGQSDRVGVRFFDNKVVEEIPATGSMEIVSKISSFYSGGREMKGPSAIGEVLFHIAEGIGRRAVVFIISDFFGDIERTFDGIKRLLGSKHEVVAIQIVDPLELNFDIPGRVQFLEMEGEGRFEARGVNIKDSFEELFHEFLSEMKTRCLSLGVDCIQCNTDRPFGIHLAEYLSGRAAR